MTTPDSATVTDHTRQWLRTPAHCLTLSPPANGS
mgnify:CR=1 FL=1